MFSEVDTVGNKLIKEKVKTRKQSKFAKHMLSTKGSVRGIPNWYFYLVILCGMCGLMTKI